MKWERWNLLYTEIERDFGFPREKEYRARDMLSRIIGKNFVSIAELRHLIDSKIYVVGNSSRMEKELDRIPENARIIAADNAAVRLYSHGITPTLVLTDLDGEIDELLRIPSIFGIHAHGDNMDKLHYAEMFPRRFGTTQIEPLWNVYNFGGFTDGDRGVFLAAHFGAEIHLIGFDFENPTPKTGKSMELKRKKLKWAKKLIKNLEKEGAKIVWEGGKK